MNLTPLTELHLATPEDAWDYWDEIAQFYNLRVISHNMRSSVTFQDVISSNVFCVGHPQIIVFVEMTNRIREKLQDAEDRITQELTCDGCDAKLIYKREVFQRGSVTFCSKCYEASLPPGMV